MPDKPQPHKSETATQKNPEVETFLRGLTHPLKQEVEKVRQIVLDIDPKISEAIKWNAPSFKTTDFFATFHLRETKSLQIILHMGAKAKTTAQTGVQIEDPTHLCEWLSKDRCRVDLGAKAEIERRLPAFAALLQQWLKWL